MKNSEHILREWCKQINCYYQLNIEEAQKLYIKMINSEGIEKEQYRYNLIEGMLYLIPKFINTTILPYLKGNSYDMNDVINVCNEELIKFIDSGRLLNIDSFSDIFKDEFYKEISYSIVPKYDFYNCLNVNVYFFIGILTWFVNENNAGRTVSYEEFLNYLNNYLNKYGEKVYDVFPYKCPVDIYNILLDIYSYLKINGYNDKEISLRQVRFFKSMIIDNVLSKGNYKDIVIDDHSDIYIKKVLEDQIFDKIFNNMKLRNKEKEILKCRYGISDGEFKTSKATGDIFGMTRAGADISVKRTIKRIKKRGKELLPLIEDYFEE